MSIFRHKVLTAFVVMSFTTLAIMYSGNRLISTFNYLHLEDSLKQNQIHRSTDQAQIYRNDSLEDAQTVSNLAVENIFMKDLRRLLEAELFSENFSTNTKENEGKVSKELQSETKESVKAYQSKPELEDRRIELDHPKKESNNETLRIVMYHIYHTQLKWATAKLDMSKCYHSSNCEIIHQGKCATDPIKADAIVFQGNNMPRDRPPRLNADQVFVYLNIESPQYLQQVRLGNPFFKDFFNWTMTYRQDSDIPYLYGSVLPGNVDKRNYLSNAEMTSGVPIIKTFHEKYLTTDGRADEGRKNYSAIFREKNKSSVWFVSHCKTASKRELYISQMEKFTNIDIFGRCTNETNQCPKGNPQCGENVKNTYKFFLSFENSLCEDYITEKVYRWFSQDIVIVVRGARYYKRYLPDGTYIDADDFKTPADLAKFLTQLGSNEEEYIKYLKRKDNYMVISEDKHVQLAYCNLCYKLNNLERFRKEAHLLNGWWNDGKCIKPNDIW